MPVDTKHRDLEALEGKHIRCRDCAGGSDAVKTRGTAHLPMLSGMKEDPGSYDKYKQRALFYGAFPRTIEGISGLVFRRPTVVKGPASALIDDIIGDTTATGLGIDRFAERVFKENLLLGRGAIYATLPRTASPDAVAYQALYRGENVINWTKAYDGQKFSLVRVVLREDAPLEGNDPYKPKMREQFRDLYLDEFGLLVSDVWVKKDGPEAVQSGEGFELVDRVMPQVRGQRVNFIPVVLMPDIDPIDPYLLALADANLHHYRMSADYAHGLHFTALPTPWASGFEVEGELRIGSGVAWVTSNKDARVGMLEYTGQGLAAVETALTKTEGYMATLGARLLEADKRAIESAETHKLRQGREQATSASIIADTEQALSRSTTMQHELSGGTGEITVELNRDLVDAKLSPEELTALTQAYQGGGISYATFYENLIKGEIARSGITAEEELEAIESDRPQLAGGDEIKLLENQDAEDLVPA